ncbi:MAG TPA: hypothetical protein PKC18_15780, partial [Lacipirellulaceae bacterium]|nr:hypothetical protein [Lacipirellulaceae bacterium]
ELQEFRDRHPWRYPAVPPLAATPLVDDAGREAFEWGRWFEGIGPWLDDRLAAAIAEKRPRLADVVSDARGLWRWLTAVPRRQRGDAAFCGRAVLLGAALEEIYVRAAIDELAKSGRSLKRTQKDKALKKRKFNTPEQVAQALAIIERYFEPPYVKITPACVNAAPVILREMGIDACPEVLRRLWNANR